MNKKIIILALLICCLFNLSVKGEGTLFPLKLIENYIDDLDKNQWEKASYWWVEKHRKELLDFIADKENKKYKRGLLNIKEADLVGWKELPNEYGMQFLPTRYIKKFNNPRVFFVGVNYKVHTQNEFYINGVNYFLIAMVLEGREWKIAMTPHVPVRSIIDDGYGFGTEDERTFDERRLIFQNRTID